MMNLNKQPTAVSSYVKFMCRQPEAQRAAYADLWDRMLSMRGHATDAKATAADMGLDPSAASWHCRKLREGEDYPTGSELLTAVLARVEATHEAVARRARERAANPPASPYHPGAPTLPGHRSPSA
jgi:hypothetical protein